MSGWVRSTFSSGSGECVEVRLAPTMVDVRDSKLRRGGLITVPSRSWAPFLVMITNR